MIEEASAAPPSVPLVTSVKIEGEMHAVFKDRFGVEHRAPPLTGADRRDLTASMGPLIEWPKYLLSTNTQDLVIFCSLRKEGRSRKQIRERDWVLTIDDVANLFEIGAKGIALELWLTWEILGNSGLRFEKSAAAADPPPPAVTTGSAA